MIRDPFFDDFDGPRQEAQRLVGDERFARVLEPSPPAVLDGDFFADDPVRAQAPAGTEVVSPVTGPDVSTTWDDWLAQPAHADHAAWAAERWLGAYRRLPVAPATLVDTRLALHRLAVYVISPARRQVNTKIGLRFTRGGFGTPFFQRTIPGPRPLEHQQVRVAGTTLVHQVGGGTARSGSAAAVPLTTLSRAAAMILEGPPDEEWAKGFDVPPLGDPDEDLAIDPEAAAFLGDWYGFSWSVLEELRADAHSTDAGRVQLWPEHFDIAIGLGPAGAHADIGGSPGDDNHPEPYVYVSPWDPHPNDPYWNEPFGASLSYQAILEGASALAFFRRGAPPSLSLRRWPGWGRDRMQGAREAGGSDRDASQDCRQNVGRWATSSSLRASAPATRRPSEASWPRSTRPWCASPRSTCRRVLSPRRSPRRPGWWSFRASIGSRDGPH